MISSGTRFGRLTVISCIDDTLPMYKRVWKCVCDCGQSKDVPESYLIKGITRSCGCLRSEKSYERRIKHGGSHHKLYRVWQGMKRRCYRKSTPEYRLYGGKGVYVCDEWHDFGEFMRWSLENGYQDGLSIDRIDSNGPYSPGNCRWTDSITQNNHTSRNHMLTFNGKTMSMADWARETGISYNAIKSRINKHGWSVERALTTK